MAPPSPVWCDFGDARHLASPPWGAGGPEPFAPAAPEAPAARSRAARRRARQRQGGAAPAAALGPQVTALMTSPSKSPAEVLELLASPPARASPPPAYLAELAYVPSPMAFSTGPTSTNSHQDSIQALLSRPSLEQLGESPERSGELLARLDAAGRAERGQVLAGLLKVAKPLALSKHGCRVVQKALEVASSADRDGLVAELEPFVEELYDSPHGNHVLSKIVEVMPSAAIGFVVEKLVGKGTAVARHRFGCRVLERLIEHCDETQIGPLIEEIVAESGALCKHPYGNFVVQHLVEHSPPHRAPILERMLEDLPVLAGHRTASHVVQKVMDYSDDEGKQAIVEALLRAESPQSLSEVACSRYGSFVVEQLAGMSEAGDEVKQSIAEHSDELSQSPFGKRVLERFGLVAPSEEALCPTGDA